MLLPNWRGDDDVAVIAQRSAGGVVFRRRAAGIEVCLILDSYGYWTFPKGKVEAGETEEQAALREIAEEVALRDLRVLGHVSDAAYRYRGGSDVIKKTVYWYLMEAPPDAEPRPQPGQKVEEAGWFEPEAALKMIGYRTVRSALRRALEMLGERGIVI
jgi:ADP-ribose pyrophosphatase YjhB (NUDIX family)